jgi:hypothetical protein
MATSIEPPPRSITTVRLFRHSYGVLQGSGMESRLASTEHPICPHSCVSDPTFYQWVQKKIPNLLLGWSVNPFFSSWRRGKSRVWKCKRKGCGARAWVQMGRDTGVVALQISQD